MGDRRDFLKKSVPLLSFPFLGLDAAFDILGEVKLVCTTYFPQPLPRDQYFYFRNHWEDKSSIGQALERFRQQHLILSDAFELGETQSEWRVTFPSISEYAHVFNEFSRIGTFSDEKRLALGFLIRWSLKNGDQHLILKDERNGTLIVDNKISQMLVREIKIHV